MMNPPATTALACTLALGALALAGCGSSSSSSSAASSTSTPAQSSTAASTTTPATTSAHIIKLTVPGSPTGSKADLHVLVKLPRSPRQVQKGRISFLSGLSLDSQLQYLANQANGFWSSEFQQAGDSLAPGTIDIILPGGSIACGSSVVTTSSGPEWCSGTDSVYLPYDYIKSNVAPKGNAATALVVFDMYGYHVEKALGAFAASPALSGVQLEELDSCLSGVWFGGLGPNYAQATDEQAVNRQLATDAAISQQFGANAAVSTTQLTTAFDDGAISQGNPAVCVHDA